MKLAPIVPFGAEDLLPQGIERRFLFANMMTDDQTLRSYVSADYKGIVLDNLIYEGIPPVPPGRLAEIADALKPTMVILPDVRGPAADSLRLSETYMSHLSDSVRVVGVIQGLSEADNRRCLDTYGSWGLKDFSVPFRLPKRELTRRQIVEQVIIPGIPADGKIHLLGGSWPYKDEIYILKHHPQVESMDTAEPANATLANKVLFDGPHPRPNDFNSLKTAVKLFENRELLWYNIGLLQALLATPQEYAALVERMPQ